MELQEWLDYVSERIHEAREQAGLTQSQLAERSGIPQGHISKIEAGKHAPSAVTLEKLTKALGIQLDTFNQLSSAEEHEDVE